MKRIQVLPDVHHKINRVKKIIEQNNFDELVSLGDWFDDFGDTPDHATRTAEYLLELQATYGKRFTWLLGNHDVMYTAPHGATWYHCSGFSYTKERAARAVLTDKLDWNQIQLAYIIDPVGFNLPIVLSHAGLSLFHFAKSPNDKTLELQHVKLVLARAMLDVLEGKKPTRLLGAGLSRGGRELVGGIDWQDWNGDFEPAQGYHQIVGHTPCRVPQVMTQSGHLLPYDLQKVHKVAGTQQLSVCLDTHLRHYAVLEVNGEEDCHKLMIYEYDEYE
jgi:hypothetical protein